MQLPPSMTRTKLVKRYKRFLADVEFADGTIKTVHCANTGSMSGLTDPGLPVWVWRSENTSRKLAWSLELIELENTLVGINTSRPNQLVAEALKDKKIPPLAKYSRIIPEMKYGEKSRIDFLLSGPGLPDCYVEVKNVHYSTRSGLAQFPDSATSRGARHLDEMGRMCQKGHRAATIYVVQRTDCTEFSLCKKNDPDYVAAFARARKNGVESYVYSCAISPRELKLCSALEFTSQ